MRQAFQRTTKLGWGPNKMRQAFQRTQVGVGLTEKCEAHFVKHKLGGPNRDSLAHHYILGYERYILAS